MASGPGTSVMVPQQRQTIRNGERSDTGQATSRSIPKHIQRRSTIPRMDLDSRQKRAFGPELLVASPPARTSFGVESFLNSASLLMLAWRRE